MIGYKAFNSDLTCRGFQYEIGKSYEMDGEIEICERGFHFCENISDCFYYYSQSDARFAKVEAYGDVIKSDEDSKYVTNKIRILKEIPRYKAIEMSNSGSHNSGNRNTGDYNSGHYNFGDCNSGSYNSGSCNSGSYNTGDYNSGNYNSGACNSRNHNSGNYNSGSCNSGNYNSGKYNSGHCNSGNYNSGNYNSGSWNLSSYNNGCFMTTTPTIMMFNKPTDWTLYDWLSSSAMRIMLNCPAEDIDFKWIYSSKMTAEERAQHPEHTTTGGYLKKIECKSNRQEWWNKLSENDKTEVMSLPNFDADVFYKCTGIVVEKEDE